MVICFSSSNLKLTLDSLNFDSNHYQSFAHLIEYVLHVYIAPNTLIYLWLLKENMIFFLPNSLTCLIDKKSFIPWVLPKVLDDLRVCRSFRLLLRSSWTWALGRRTRRSSNKWRQRRSRCSCTKIRWKVSLKFTMVCGL